MTIAEMRRATHEAASDAVAGISSETEGTESTEATGTEGDATSAASAEGGTDVGTEEAPDSSEAHEGTDEVPDSYFGLDLSGLEPERRLEIIGELKKRDDNIGKLLRGRPDETPQTEEVSTDAAPTPATDEEILQALGLDPENPFDEQAAKVAVPLVRRQLEQEGMLAQLIEMQELNEIDRSWRSTLSSLEREFGALPTELDHDTVMEFAAENDIGSPVDAYWRIVGPGRAALTEALSKEQAKRLAAAKAASATTRPGGKNADEEAPLESKTTKGATREAARRLLSEFGLND